jgi:hypothetical protein
MTAKTFIVGGGVAIALVVLYLDQRGIRAELTALRAELPKAGSERAEHGRAERREVVWLGPPAPVEPSPTGSRDEAAAPSEPTPQPVAQPKPLETPIEQFALVHDTLEQKFGSQANDGGWAMDARRSVETKLADLPVASRLGSIECRSTLCRVETIHDRYSDARDFTSRLASLDRRPWNGGFYTGPISEDPQNGAVTFVTYLVREGMELPDIPDRGDDAPASR